ncbi:MAG TPA: HIT domain-containing protein [Bacteroidota bacterium]|nr:HIT domain-containing protein [Bacteroidota bacterium]
MGCIFCNIIAKETPAEILFENDCAISILDVNPIHYGHALVIPKNHHKDFLDVPEKELAGIMHAAHVVSRALVKSFALEGFNFFSNNGTVAGQSVFHFHIHITPRYLDDNIRFVLKLKRYEGDDMKAVAAKIRASILE